MNLAKCTKLELVWMSQHRCKHGHLFIEHPACFEEKKKERIGFLDIECSNLSADFGIILSYAIKERKGKIRGRVITPGELKTKEQDKTLVRECISDMEKFDRIIGFYSARFDIPYLRSRAMAHDLHYPEYGTLKHSDLWFWAKSKMHLSRSRLQNISDFLSIPAKEHKLDGLRWTRALTGDKEALDFIFTHNKEDVVSTELLFERLLPFNRLTNTCM